MLLHYEFVLPPALDMNAIRRRIDSKRPLFDRHAGLVWKAWLLSDGSRQAGQDNRYAPLYLFEHPVALRDFLLGPLYAGVTQTFGWVRPASGPMLGHHTPRLDEARSCSMTITDCNSHAGLLAQADRRRADTEGLVGEATMIDIARMQLRHYAFWNRDAADLPAPIAGSRVYEVGAVSAPVLASA